MDNGPRRSKRKRKSVCIQNRPPTVKRKKQEKITITPFETSVKDIKKLEDLIKIGEEWESYRTELYETRSGDLNTRKNIKIYNEIVDTNDDYEKLSKITRYLEELNNLIGMKNLKKNIINQILFFVQGLHQNEMMHTVIIGEQGMGKTVVANILGNIYKDLGILKKGTFTIAQRADFVGEYLGSTAIKTQKLLESCIGGVLFIDEAYSLGNKEQRDSFSKEAIDTINQFLSENTENFICIIAGYEKSLKECFFDWNPGLERRFPWKFKLEKYTPTELRDILVYQVNELGWSYCPEDVNHILKLISDAKELFTNNGGDCLVYFDKCKIHHAKRVFGKNSPKFVLTREDFDEGMKIFKHNKADKKIKNTHLSMYL